ncbi:MAG TPA: efflux RND transporter permease subunit [Bacteroidales bacterium]|nr:efflux RND transporter permease subunit [Bacteroidales bacterium]
MSIYASAVKKPVTTLMIFIAVIVIGIYSFSRLPIDLYPEIEIPAIMVYTGYSGANAPDIETNISKPVENTLNTVSNLKEIYSTSRDNASIVTLEFEYGTDLDGAANDVRDALGMVTQYLPEGADNPIIFKFTTNMMPIMFFAVTADESYEGIEEELNEKLVNPLNRIDGIGSISLYGTPIREVSVNIDPRRMEAYNLTIEQIGNILRAENLNMPAGTVDMGQMTYPLRVQGEFEQSDQIKNIVLTNFQGKTIYLKDVADVNDSIRKMSRVETIDGRKGIRMLIMKQSGANTVRIAKEVNKQMAELKKNLPADVKIETIMDTSEFITNSINNLTETLLFAFLFVMIVVLFFLGRWRATFIIILTIPLSLIVAFIYLFISGSTINIISLSALSIGIGMVVDDAIVVLENITRHIERGSSPREAAIYATNEVWLAVIASTLTIVAVFFPLTLVSGMTGIMFKQLGWIVTITIMTSVVAAITITPMLSSKFLGLKPIRKNPGWFSHERLVVPVLDSLDNFYVRLLKWSLHHKKAIVLGAVVILCIAGIFATQLKTEFIPETDEGHLSAEIELQAGVRVEETVKITNKIEDFINKNIPEKKLLSTSSGANDQAGFAALFMNSGSNIINVNMRLVTSSERERSTADVADQLRKYIETIPEIVKYNVTAGGGFMMGGGNTVNLEIFGYDIEQTNALAADLAEKIKKIDGARDVIISREKSKPELRVTLDKEKMMQHGLNTATVSTILRNRILGLTATQFRESGNEYDVLVRFKEEYRNSVVDIESISIPTATGLIRLVDIAKVEEFWSPPSIERKRRERIVTISVTPYKVSLGEMANKIKAEIKKADVPAGIMLNVGGAYEDLEDSFKDLALLLLLSLLLVYIVMASQFESLKMPLIIMVSVPFSFTGVVFVLLLTKTTLSIIAALGAILLVGIVVKNAIVLIDFTNLMRDRGNSLDDALIKAGRSRLRPVLMTTLTTILGMLPLALSTGEGSEIWKPMGITVIGGLVFSTIITMIIVPVVYRIVVRRTERKAKKDAIAIMKSIDI